jgi:ABC-2 type transport system ATP-binding protein
MIKATELSRSYREIRAVESLSFEIAQGEVVGLLGPNGAGKTTTMRLLTTYLPPSSGSAIVAGYDITRHPAEVRRRIGYLPELPPLYPEMTVRAYLEFVAKIKAVAKVKSAVDEVLERCSLREVAERVCGNLSKGYRQRVGIAQALVNFPEVLVLDEPTSGLDPAQIVEVRKLISSLAGKHTVLLSTHILQEVSEVCSRVIMIARGKVVASGTIAEFASEGSLERRFLQAVSGV